MAEIAAETVTAQGVGVQYTDLAAGQVQMPASATGMAHVRNQSTVGDLVLSVTLEDAELGQRSLDIRVPPRATRFFALHSRLAQDGRTITFLVSGDVSNANVVVLERRRG